MKKNGFTLIELCMVIAIVAIIFATFALPRIADLDMDAKNAALHSLQGVVKEEAASVYAKLAIEGLTKGQVYSSSYPELRDWCNTCYFKNGHLDPIIPSQWEQLIDGVKNRDGADFRVGVLASDRSKNIFSFPENFDSRQVFTGKNCYVEYSIDDAGNYSVNMVPCEYI